VPDSLQNSFCGIDPKISSVSDNPVVYGQ